LNLASPVLSELKKYWHSISWHRGAVNSLQSRNQKTSDYGRREMKEENSGVLRKNYKI